MKLRTTLITVLVLASALLRASPVTEAEDQLKSAAVLSFLRYSTWPGSRPPNQPVTVAVVGRPSFASALQSLLEGKIANGRPIRILEFTPGADSGRCNLIYVATDRKAEILEVLQSPSAARALTIGESSSFLDYGGAVWLTMTDGHMAFEVSLDALARSGVEISSRLLHLGQVRRRTGE